MPALREQPLMRYLEFSVGYGTRNFEPESRALVAPTRHAYYGLSLNLSQLLNDTLFKGNATPSRTQRVTDTFFEFVQWPSRRGPGLRPGVAWRLRDLNDLRRAELC
jgi:hypothetical protein